VRVFNSELLEAEHGHAHAKNLSGTQVTMGLFGVSHIFVEGFHLLLGYRELITSHRYITYQPPWMK